MTRSGKIIIIGAGHNGLICGSYLAKAGYDVEIIEARAEVGGAVTNRRFSEDFKVSGLAHLLPSLHPRILKDLGLDQMKFYPGKLIDTIALDKQGHHLTLGRDSVSGEGLSQADIDAYREFKQEFRAYALALEPFMMGKPPRLKNMDMPDKILLAKTAWKLRFGLGAKSMSEFFRVGGINIYDVLNDSFEDARLKGAMSVDAVLGHHMGPRTPTTVLTYLHRLRGELYGQYTLPAGGMGQVSESLADVARKFGANIKTSSKVKKILINEGKVCGVLLESGEQIDADKVVSNADAKTTFLHLLDATELDTQFAHRVFKTRSYGVTAKLHYALDALPAIDGLNENQLSQRLIIAPDMVYVEHAFNHAKYGEYSQHPVIEICLPSLSDPTLAPAGKHVMSVIATFAPYQLKQQWENGRQGFADRVTALINEYAPDFTSLIVDSELMTPVDIEAEYNMSGGHWHHAEMALDQSFMMRPVHGAAQYDTPIDGLYLCSAAAHPGGGVTGLPGHNAAQRILKQGN